MILTFDFCVVIMSQCAPLNSVKPVMNHRFLAFVVFFFIVLAGNAVAESLGFESTYYY